MFILDFLIYYLTLWFTERQEKLRWSTPLERAIYAVGIASILWIFVLEELICFFVLKTSLKIAPIIVVIVIGLIIMQAYSYIYIKRKRYKLINNSASERFKTGDKTGKVLSITFILLSFIIPYLTFMIFTQ